MALIVLLAHLSKSVYSLILSLMPPLASTQSPNIASGTLVEALRPGLHHWRPARVLDSQQDHFVLRFPGDPEPQTVLRQFVRQRFQSVVPHTHQQPVAQQSKPHPSKPTTTPASVVVDLTDDSLQQPSEKSSSALRQQSKVPSVNNTSTFVNGARKACDASAQNIVANGSTRPVEKRRRPSFAESSLQTVAQNDNPSEEDDCQPSSRIVTLSNNAVHTPYASTSSYPQNRHQQHPSTQSHHPPFRVLALSRTASPKLPHEYTANHSHSRIFAAKSSSPVSIPHQTASKVLREQKRRLGISSAIASVAIPRRFQSNANGTELFAESPLHPADTIAGQGHSPDGRVIPSVTIPESTSGSTLPDDAQRVPRRPSRHIAPILELSEESSTHSSDDDTADDSQDSIPLAQLKKDRVGKRSPASAKYQNGPKRPRVATTTSQQPIREEVVASGGPVKRPTSGITRGKSRLIAVRHTSSPSTSGDGQTLKSSRATSHTRNGMPCVDLTGGLDHSSNEIRGTLLIAKPEVPTLQDTRGSGRRKSRPNRNAGQCVLNTASQLNERESEELDKYERLTSLRLHEQFAGLSLVTRPEGLGKESFSCVCKDEAPVATTCPVIQCGLCGLWSHIFCTGFSQSDIQRLQNAQDSADSRLLCTSCAEVAMLKGVGAAKSSVSKKWAVPPLALRPVVVEMAALQTSQRASSRRKTCASSPHSAYGNSLCAEGRKRSNSIQSPLSTLEIEQVKRNVDALRAGLLPRSVRRGPVADLTLYR